MAGANLALAGRIDASGGAGGHALSQETSGGGGGGGAIVIDCQLLFGSGLLRSRGGPGGALGMIGDLGSAGGGGGGAVILNVTVQMSPFIDIDVGGGAVASPIGTGVSGSDGDHGTASR